jgi:hypothetical protein
VGTIGKTHFLRENPHIIGTDQDPGLRIESFALIKVRGVNYRLYKYKPTTYELFGTYCIPIRGIETTDKNTGLASGVVDGF